MGYALRRIRLQGGNVAVESVATLPWNDRQLCDGISGNVAVESVATFARNTQLCGKKGRLLVGGYLSVFHGQWLPSLMCAEGWVEQGLCSTPALSLLPSTPGAIWLFVTVPRATVLGELLERYLVYVTVWAVIRDSRARAVCWGLCGWLCNSILLQECNESMEYYRLVCTP